WTSSCSAPRASTATYSSRSSRRSCAGRWSARRTGTAACRSLPSPPSPLSQGGRGGARAGRVRAPPLPAVGEGVGGGRGACLSSVGSSQPAFADQGEQSQDVPAVAVVEEALALAGALRRFADADVIEGAQSGAVDGETSSANFARDLVQSVEGRFLARADAE